MLWSKSKKVRLRARSDKEGLLTMLFLTPKLTSAEPWVLSCTPPGPKIFSAAPISNCKSVKEKASFFLL